MTQGYKHHQGIHRTQPYGFWLGLTNIDTVLNLLGWIITASSLLSLFSAMVLGHSYNGMTGLFLLLGVVLILRHSSLFGLSDSTRQLLSEERSGRKVAAQMVHHLAPQEEVSASNPHFLVSLLVAAGVTGVVVTYVAWIREGGIPASGQLAFFLLVPLSGLLYGIAYQQRTVLFLAIATFAGVLMLVSSPVHALYVVVLMALLSSWYAITTHDWSFLLAILLASYSVLLRWTLAVDDQPILYQTILVTQLSLVLIFSLPFFAKRRTAKERETVRAILASNCIFFLFIPFFLSRIFTQEIWFWGAAIIAFYYGCLGIAAWLHYKRFSYAKYYLLGSLVMTIVTMALSSGHTLVIFAWVLLSALLFQIGFGYLSYTARMAGLLTAAVATVAYLLTSFQQDAFLQTDELTLPEYSVTGVALAFYLALVATWYRQFHHAAEAEGHRKLWIINGLEAIAYFIVLGLIWRLFLPPVETGFFLVTGAITWWWGHRQKLPLIQALGVATSGISLVKLLFWDTFSYPLEERLFVLLAFSLIMFMSAYFIQTKLRQ